MNDTIYLDHAATTPLDKRVFEKMRPYFCEYYGNADSPHALGRKAQAAVDSARDRVAELIGAKSSEIYFTSGGTESDNWAMLGGARAKRAEGRTQIVLSAIEHHAVLSAAERLEKEGFEVVYLPVDKGGMVALQSIADFVSDKTALVCLMAVNNETGVKQP
ncbi:MAG: aminotransferase class V-fold PLP-dependent enzyme, partial [Clostridia bacterium]|nr:aminotransferase class V-fold PLP-dependent enzyme [Clostridia bacterium]